MKQSMRFGGVVFLILVVIGKADDNGLALTPPLGWRSWNLFGDHVNQTLLEGIMDSMARRTFLDHDTNEPISLCDIGYCDVGLDDNWQACHSPEAAPGMHYHDTHGKPIINYDRFPNLTAMVNHAHSLNLTAGWYGNNCICRDTCRNERECELQMRGDAQALLDYGFDGWKLDGCGGEVDLVKVHQILRELSPQKPILVENCHWGSVVPYRPDPSQKTAEKSCPWNFYRSSGDIGPSYGSILNNLQSMTELYQKNLSYPGCWAYPDMLMVGCSHTLTFAEERTHFGAWAIVSSPLILSHDVNDHAESKRIWPLIANKEVLRVNQAYYGDSGGPYHISHSMITLYENLDMTNMAKSSSDNITLSSNQVPSYRYLSKTLGGGQVAVLLINSAPVVQTLQAIFEDIQQLQCNVCHVRDIWNHKDLGVFSTSWSVAVDPHDAAFIIVQPVSSQSPLRSHVPIMD
eukprot:scaffold23434_cov53-Attheya_sp.AAC.2